MQHIRWIVVTIMVAMGMALMVPASVNAQNSVASFRITGTARPPLPDTDKEDETIGGGPTESLPGSGTGSGGAANLPQAGNRQSPIMFSLGMLIVLLAGAVWHLRKEEHADDENIVAS